MTTWFTADTHFGHGSLRALLRRPFPSTAAMDDALAAAWNEAVQPNDEIWHLGDFAVGHPDPGGLLAALNGTKHLVTGNNDPPATRALPGWASARDYAEIEADGQALVLCHYPFRTWNGGPKGAWNLHGHSHGRLKPLPRQFDVGVDPRGYRPVRVADLRPARAAKGAA
ncbi:metallophosphoesterase [Roseomonas nepalensis]|uniref:Metallophosphoesterase n=1 Tax=Muricoccus nepalensis TaxID=1854500 RepID=A0A502G5S5_9PROT|nr:metallophosphoesterase family protein [Roseomonas nepalensis]TPG56911.1 metallophosphoesterase [Roseomonas nepalensis]